MIASNMDSMHKRRRIKLVSGKYSKRDEGSSSVITPISFMSKPNSISNLWIFSLLEKEKIREIKMAMD